ncbi:MAG: ribosome biogenesis GTPase Der [Chloroflexi bacterium]|nr:ribosome biogenesis GTPase Der [Chloroflexota bacterium]
MPDGDRQLPLVALIGRPNVGKSTLFNRLVGERSAVVEPQPGTTRDRIYGELEWRGRAFAVVDTAGIAWHDPAPVAEAAVAQARAAADEADLVLVVTDVQTGVTELDGIVAREVLRRQRPHLLVVNKADHMDLRLDTGEFYALGLGEPAAISAMHGTATGDLLDAVAARLPAVAYTGEPDELPRLAIVGRPNVGKSSLLNALLGETRALVHDAPGTTRDSIDTLLEWEGRSIRLIDTAGIRRRGHIDSGVEYHSVLRAVRSIQRCDVGLLVVDAHEGATAQDAHVAGLVLEAGKGIVVLANKWDMLQDPERRKEVDFHLERVLHFLPEAPFLHTSALTGRGVPASVSAGLQVHEVRQTRVATGPLNRFLRAWAGRRGPPSRKGRQARFKYATQIGVSPPSFVTFFARPENVHPSYVRYLENGLREAFGFDGTPIVIRLRPS